MLTYVAHGRTSENVNLHVCPRLRLSVSVAPSRLCHSLSFSLSLSGKGSALACSHRECYSSKSLPQFRLPVRLIQPECACAADGGNITAPDLCCRERSPCTPRLDAEARPVQYVNDASAVTFWQSTPEGGATDQYTVNVTLDLLIQQVTAKQCHIQHTYTLTYIHLHTHI